MEPNHGIESQNSRLNHIKRFIAKPPPGASKLRLIGPADDDRTQITLNEWDASTASANAMLAHDINALITEHAESIGTRETQFRLVFIELREGQDDRAIGTKVLRHRRAANPIDDASLAHQDFDGGSGDRNTIVQCLRHNEMHTRVYLTAHQAQLSQANQLAMANHDRAAEATARADKYREELYDLKEALLTVREEQLAEAEGTRRAPRSGTEDKVFAVIQQYLPMFAAKMLAPPPPEPPKPPRPPKPAPVAPEPEETEAAEE